MEFSKSDTGKARLDLLPPELMLGVSHVLAHGAEKYSARNWELGAEWGRYYAALQRHMLAWWSGEDNDEETGMSHLWHAGCCLAFLIAYEARNLGKDDRPTGDPHASVQQEKSVTTSISPTSEIAISITKGEDSYD